MDIRQHAGTCVVIRRVVTSLSDVHWKHSCSLSTSACVQRIRDFSTTMRYINRHYLSIYLSIYIYPTAWTTHFGTRFTEVGLLPCWMHFLVLWGVARHGGLGVGVRIPMGINEIDTVLRHLRYRCPHDNSTASRYSSLMNQNIPPTKPRPPVIKKSHVPDDPQQDCQSAS